MTSPSILDRVQSLVARIAGASRTPVGAGPDTPLGEGGYWLDSVDLLEVAVACEREFGLPFDAESDLSAETLTTVRSLAEMIRRKGIA